MEPDVGGATRVRLYLARDAQKRDLFVPWHPFSRAAYVLKGPIEREEIRRRVELYLAFGLGVVIGVLFAGIFSDAPDWLPLLVSILLVAGWSLWSWRRTRGLERTRYEKPAS